MQKRTVDEPDGPAIGSAKPAPAMAQARPKWRMPQRRFVVMLALMLLGPLLALAAGTYIYMAGGRFIETDNAYIKADKIAVSADISGRVEAVMVKSDQHVKRGDLLFRIDQQPFRIALERAEAKLAAAIQDVDSLRAIYQQRVARLKLADGDLKFQEQNYERQNELTQRGVVSRSGMDTAEKSLRNARDQMAVLQQEMAEISAKLGGDAKRATKEHPAVREAEALRDQAALDLKHTEVRAPATGIITNFDLQPGEYVTLGNVVFSMVGTDELWVQANFKETDLTNMQPGQKATFHVDSYPDKTWTGSVTSISPATGAEFAILPPQNATGNWVKVVQRLPVRLKIDPLEGAKPLRAGMSVVVEVDTKNKRSLPKWMSRLFGMAQAQP
ncbi:MAG: HlyD family secretion protein [Hyphomicrobiaceae bacterium]